MEREKLPRLPMGNHYYTTGEDSLWTYEYTNEDWEASFNFPSAPIDSEYGKLKAKIKQYFRDNPDKAAKYDVNIHRFR